MGVERGCGTVRPERRALSPTRLGPLALVVGLMVLVAPQLASAQPAQAGGPSSPAVSFVAQPSTAPCAVFPAGVIRNVGSTATTFTVTIVVPRNLCTPVGATAAVYAMPSATVAWPQTLVSRTPFTMQQSGTYTVTFSKGCDPQQFDLIAGTSNSVTPPTIAPTGPWHGPLLFPFDTTTALQWPGNCTPTTTTTSTTSTTSTSTTSTTTSSTTSTTVPTSTTTPSSTTTPGPTTTVPADVAGETTVPTTVPVTVAGIQQSGSTLAFTGVGPLPTLVGAGLIGLGLLLMMFGRRPISER